MIQLPEDHTAERSLISTICAPGSERKAAECVAELRSEDFVDPAHRACLAAVTALIQRGEAIEIPVLADELRKNGALDRMGGYTGLLEILSGEEVRRPMVLVGVLQKLRRRRDLMKLASRIGKGAQADEEDPEAICSEAAQELARINAKREKGGIKHIAQFSDDLLSNLLDRFNGIRDPNVSWLKGWSRLNGMLQGFKPGELIILAARPGIGKTALALNWAMAVTEYGGSAGIFSLEMPKAQLWERLVAAQAGVDLRAMISGRDSAAFHRVGNAKLELDQRGIWIEDRSSITAQEILTETDSLIARSSNLRLLVVDYLGLVGGGSAKASETQRLAEITRGLKVLAKDRGVPVLLLCQLNREVETRANGKPRLSDLRDSGAIEQDADVVMFIHRKMTELRNEKTAELLIAKQRSGPTGIIPLLFHPELTRYEEQPARETSNALPESWAEPIPNEPILEEAI